MSVSKVIVIVGAFALFAGSPAHAWPWSKKEKPEGRFVVVGSSGNRVSLDGQKNLKEAFKKADVSDDESSCVRNALAELGKSDSYLRFHADITKVIFLFQPSDTTDHDRITESFSDFSDTVLTLHLDTSCNLSDLNLDRRIKEMHKEPQDMKDISEMVKDLNQAAPPALPESVNSSDVKKIEEQQPSEPSPATGTPAAVSPAS